MLCQEDKGDRLEAVSGNWNFLGASEAAQNLNLPCLTLWELQQGAMVERVVERDMTVADT